MAEKYLEAVGRRKTAIARVRITPAKKSEVLINGKPLAEYLPTAELMTTVLQPFQKTDAHFSVSAKVFGGGISAQAEAIRHGIARALLKYDAELRKELKLAGYLKRDPRMKERKKFGLRKARRAPQWSKR
ncbi:30S ribosomal protein S9 [Candidatus Kaiserbacteria bacterium CG10_big_fil_rev_8_21_14_0_10_49_17]|uniref:Small ribosomal subunit protein uS9 n=1 Tax=Candidatus Kaiserbacteria bacterium CG10_big_fil_rev_8_21_14_0_10_49_17 TaxID=1974609 RepID=A0A2M6WF51_9BACT|nr:MAG: 30S ribosomal protein S9 [Candidatus Kaiserbacteria bacterium CG10_big_fil_rev_8_21_14_0_10_49_17]